MKLFLDIDGVMVHANPHRIVDLDDDGFYKFSHNAIEAINSFDHTNVEVILSTSHRFRYNTKQWQQIFRKRGINFAKISIIEFSLENRYSRRIEIERWIAKRNINPEDIIILDDDKSLNGLPERYKKRLILTNSYTGLRSPDELNLILRENKNKED